MALRLINQNAEASYLHLTRIVHWHVIRWPTSSRKNEEIYKSVFFSALTNGAYCRIRRSASVAYSFISPTLPSRPCLRGKCKHLMAVSRQFLQIPSHHDSLIRRYFKTLLL